MTARHRAHWAFALISLPLAWLACTSFSNQPFYTDAYYHYNAAAQIAAGRGYVDEYLWTYIGMPDSLPAPSHLYWMPMTSTIAALGLASGGYLGLQAALALCLWGAALLAYHTALRGGTLRRAWLAGLMAISGGFYLRFWGTTDTFAPYALFGGATLFGLGLAAERGGWRWSVAGVCAGLAHLTRSDGLLLVAVGGSVALWPGRACSWRERIAALALFVAGYSLAMLPWWMRNLWAIGTPLSLGGTQALWYTEYDDLFRYPPQANPQDFFAVGGWPLLLATRWYGLRQALENLIGVEGFIVLTPFMLLALWQVRRQPFWRATAWFALGIHLAFPLLFPFPSARGGMFHAGAGLLAAWTALGLMGIEQATAWIARRRRAWRVGTAQVVFSAAAAALVLWLSLFIALPRRAFNLSNPYAAIDALLPEGARVMINDSAQFFYYTGRGGVVIPNEPPEVIPLLAARYGVDYVLFEPPNLPPRMAWEPLPPFLQPIEGWEGLYAIRP
ncbi:MAG: glycosyltransferase family 39 protein [Anaerolineae bacterium]|nr:glycosyltransferase family 39 protein [Anaerolineae bacterium]MDW8172407.1 hypothetical protein [Anaerolineae bacterium]